MIKNAQVIFILEKQGKRFAMNGKIGAGRDIISELRQRERRAKCSIVECLLCGSVKEALSLTEKLNDEYREKYGQFPFESAFIPKAKVRQ